jgi:hypothetical protein
MQNMQNEEGVKSGTFSIGSSKDNEIAISNQSVSREHAEILYHDYDFVVIKDCDSTNGVYVNDRRVRKKRLTPGDKVVLGNYALPAAQIFKKVREQINKHKLDFTEEYKEIYQNMLTFQKRKNKIIDPSKRLAVSRGLMGAVIIGVLIFFPEIIPNDSVRYGLIMSVGIIATFFNAIFSNNLKKHEKLDKLKLEYEEKLKCPKCGRSYINQTPTYLVGKGECLNPKCDATFRKIDS